MNLGPPVAIYDYRDESGRVLYLKRRYEPEMGAKTFRTFHDTERGWRGGIDPKGGERNRRVLYNLPDLVKASVALLSEGEKCANALTEANLFANAGYAVASTTTYDGAWQPGQKPKWLDTYAPYFTGKQTLIFPDNDAPSLAFAEYAAAVIAPYAFNVRIVHLPDIAEGEDVADFLGKHPVADLEKAIRESKTWTPPGAVFAQPLNRDQLAILTAELLEALVTWVTTFVVVSDFQADILAVWLMRTYIMMAACHTPYLNITGPEKHCGKTLLMDVLRAVACNAQSTSGITPAALIRVVDSYSPTLSLDQMDAAQKGNQELAQAARSILNAGSKRGGQFIKCVGKEFEPQHFNVFGPKCLAGIGSLPATVTDRAIVIETRRKLPSVRVKKFRTKVAERDAAPVKSKLER